MGKTKIIVAKIFVGNIEYKEVTKYVESVKCKLAIAEDLKRDDVTVIYVPVWTEPDNYLEYIHLV
jgi:hypothetical protein